MLSSDRRRWPVTSDQLSAIVFNLQGRTGRFHHTTADSLALESISTDVNSDSSFIVNWNDANFRKIVLYLIWNSREPHRHYRSRSVWPQSLKIDSVCLTDPAGSISRRWLLAVVALSEWWWWWPQMTPWARGSQCFWHEVSCARFW